MNNQILIIGFIILQSFGVLSFTTSLYEEDDKNVCFELENERFTNHIIITFSHDNKVEGTLDVHIHDEEMGYETSSYSEFTGVLSGDNLNVNLLIEIEGEEVEDSQTWKYKNDEIVIDENVYKKVDCKKYE